MSLHYVGRFAPSPTGPLHFGSLLAALASYLDARANRGTWLVRIDDIDPPREQHGADKLILSALERHGLLWDDEPLRQAKNEPAQQRMIDDLLDTDRAFHCTCSRRDVAEHHHIYPGTCREKSIAPGRTTSIRLKVDADITVTWQDRLQGPQKFHHDQLGGDFVIRRRDQLIAYQLACAVDDIQHGITHVVRGSDLLDSTARQILIMTIIGEPPPSYAHIPVVVDEHGAKLSKQTGAVPLDPDQAETNLAAALLLLGQECPTSVAKRNCTHILDWAVDHWNLASVPSVASIHGKAI